MVEQHDARKADAARAGKGVADHDEIDGDGVAQGLNVVVRHLEARDLIGQREGMSYDSKPEVEDQATAERAVVLANLFAVQRIGLHDSVGIGGQNGGQRAHQGKDAVGVARGHLGSVEAEEGDGREQDAEDGALFEHSNGVLAQRRRAEQDAQHQGAGAQGGGDVVEHDAGQGGQRIERRATDQRRQAAENVGLGRRRLIAFVHCFIGLLEGGLRLIHTMSRTCFYYSMSFIAHMKAVALAKRPPSRAASLAIASFKWAARTSSSREATPRATL